MTTVVIDAGARRSWGLPPLLPVGIEFDQDGLALRIAEDGQVFPIMPPRRPRPGCTHATARRGREAHQVDSQPCRVGGAPASAR